MTAPRSPWHDRAAYDADIDAAAAKGAALWMDVRARFEMPPPLPAEFVAYLDALEIEARDAWIAAGNGHPSYYKQKDEAA